MPLLGHVCIPITTSAVDIQEYRRPAEESKERAVSFLHFGLPCLYLWGTIHKHMMMNISVYITTPRHNFNIPAKSVLNNVPSFANRLLAAVI